MLNASPFHRKEMRSIDFPPHPHPPPPTITTIVAAAAASSECWPDICQFSPDCILGVTDS
jgi:hypothetical protein